MNTPKRIRYKGQIYEKVELKEDSSANPDHIKIIGRASEHKENGRGDYVTYINVHSDAFDDDFHVTCYDYLPQRFYGEYVGFKPVITDAVWEFIKKERRKNKDLQSYISQNIDLINKLYAKKYGDVFESNN